MSTGSRSAFYSIGSTVLLAFMTVALLHGMYFEIEPGAAWRQLSRGQFPQINIEREVTQATGVFRDAAHGGNLAMHFSGFQAGDPRMAHLVAQNYFLAQYALFPRQVIMGQGDRIINSAADFLAADFLEDDQWLVAHDVRGSITIQGNANGSLGIDVRTYR